MPDTDHANDEPHEPAEAVQTTDSGLPGPDDRDVPPPPEVSWQMPAPPVSAIDLPGAPIRLWRPADVAVVSFLLGFPGGLGLVARNAWRLGRRGRAWVQLAGGTVGILAVVLVPVSGNSVAAVLNIAVAVYVYYQAKSDLETAKRAGHPVERGGVPSGFATILGAWALTLAVAFVGVLFLALASGTATQLGNAALASSSPAPSRPNGDPELAALLPATVNGQRLAHESYRGRDLFVGPFGLTDANVTGIGTDLAALGLKVDDVSLAVDGRSGPSDPPYFVNALRIKGLPTEQWQAKLGLDPGALEVDHPTAGTFTTATVGGKTVLRGTLGMVDQTTHARGIPYLYGAGDVRFVVVTDDPAWAADAMRQLP